MNKQDMKVGLIALLIPLYFYIISNGDWKIVLFTFAMELSGFLAVFVAAKTRGHKLSFENQARAEVKITDPKLKLLKGIYFLISGTSMLLLMLLPLTAQLLYPLIEHSVLLEAIFSPPIVMWLLFCGAIAPLSGLEKIKVKEKKIENEFKK